MIACRQQSGLLPRLDVAGVPEVLVRRHLTLPPLAPPGRAVPQGPMSLPTVLGGPIPSERGRPSALDASLAAPGDASLDATTDLSRAASLDASLDAPLEGSLEGSSEGSLDQALDAAIDAAFASGESPSRGAAHRTPGAPGTGGADLIGSSVSLATQSFTGAMRRTWSRRPGRLSSADAQQALERARAGQTGALEAATRFSVDGSEMVGYPVVTLGDKPCGEIVHEGGLAESGPLRRVSFPTIGWELSTPAGTQDGERLPSSAILDVYLAVLFLWGQAGFPEDGKIYFSRYEMLQLMGWLSTNSGGKVQRMIKPSGRHYKQLEAAFTYLMRTLFVNRSQAEQVNVIDGQKMRGVQKFPIVQYMSLSEDQPGPKSEGSGLPKRSMFQLSSPFVRMLGQGKQTVPVDLDLFFSLPNGTPRHLCRLFAWMWEQKVNTMPIGEIFQRLGSTQTETVPARARQILGKAHAELRQRGVLSAEPEYVKRDGAWHISYQFGAPEEALSAEQVLAERVMALGVTPVMARELSVAYRLPLETMLAATITGRLRPTRSLASMVVYYTRKGVEAIYAAVEQEDLRRRGVAPQMHLPMASADEQYIAWCKRERTLRMAKRPDIDVAALTANIEEDLAVRCPDHPRWVVDGLVLLHLDRELEMPSLERYAFDVAGQVESDPAAARR